MARGVAKICSPRVRQLLLLFVKNFRVPLAFSLFLIALGFILYLLAVTKTMHGVPAAFFFLMMLGGAGAALSALDADAEPKIVGKTTWCVAFLAWPALVLVFLFEAYGIFKGCLDVLPPHQRSSCAPDCGGGCQLLVWERILSGVLYGCVAVHAIRYNAADGTMCAADGSRSLAQRLLDLKACVRVAACGKLALTILLYPIMFATEPAFGAILAEEGFFWKGSTPFPIFTDADACNADPYDAEPTFLVLLFSAALSQVVFKYNLRMDFAREAWEEAHSLFADDDEPGTEMSRARDSVADEGGPDSPAGSSHGPVKGAVQQAQLSAEEKRKRCKRTCAGGCCCLLLVVIITAIRVGVAGSKANYEDRCGIDTPDFDPLCLRIVHGWNYYSWTDENIMRGLIRWSNPHARASHIQASAYYDAHVELARAHRPKHKLHWVFTGTADLLEERGTWPNFYDLIELRMVQLGKVLVAHGRDDFRIEKDKCKLMEWMARNKIRMAPFNGPWHDTGEIVAKTKSGAAFAGISPWPMFLKACHLTSASAKSVIMLHNQSHASAIAEGKVRDWLENEMEYHADDWDRSWRAANNFLTDTFPLPKGFLAQAAANLSTNPMTHHKQMYELKLETIFGYPYMAWSDMCCTKARYDPYQMRYLCDGDCNILRWPNGTVDVEVFEESTDLIAQAAKPMPDDAWYRWVKDEPAYLECAWNLARRVSKLMAIDEIRVDIFLTYGDPHGCAMNECSISSGVPYGSHYRYLAELWSEGHMTTPRDYQVLHTDKKVYDLTEADVDPP